MELFRDTLDGVVFLEVGTSFTALHKRFSRFEEWRPQTRYAFVGVWKFELQKRNERKWTISTI